MFKGQVWRVLTPFFNFGTVGPVNWVWGMYIAWTYMAGLEKSLYKTPEDFALMLAVGMSCLIGVTTLCGITYALQTR